MVPEQTVKCKRKQLPQLQALTFLILSRILFTQQSTDTSRQQPPSLFFGPNKDVPSRLQYQFMQMEAQAQRPTQLTTPPGSQDTLSPAPTAHREKGSTHWTGGEWVAEGSG